MILFKPGTIVKFKDEFKGELPIVVQDEPWMILGEHKGHQHYAVFTPKYTYGDIVGGIITNDKYVSCGTWVQLHKMRLLTREEKATFNKKDFPTLAQVSSKRKNVVKRSNVRVAVTIRGLSYGGNEYNMSIEESGAVHIGPIANFTTISEAIEFAKKIQTPAGAATAPGVHGQRHRVALLVKYGRNLLPLLRLIKRLQNMKGRIIVGSNAGELTEDNKAAIAAENEAQKAKTE